MCGDWWQFVVFIFLCVCGFATRIDSFIFCRLPIAFFLLFSFAFRDRYELVCHRAPRAYTNNIYLHFSATLLLLRLLFFLCCFGSIAVQPCTNMECALTFKRSTFIFLFVVAIFLLRAHRAINLSLYCSREKSIMYIHIRKTPPQFYRLFVYAIRSALFCCRCCCCCCRLLHSVAFFCLFDVLFVCLSFVPNGA